MTDAVALTVEHSDNFIAHHERNRKLRAGRLRGANVTGVFGHVGGVDGLLLQDRGSGDAVMMSQTKLVFPVIPADLGADTQLLGLLVEQEDSHIAQLKEV